MSHSRQQYVSRYPRPPSGEARFFRVLARIAIVLCVLSLVGAVLFWLRGTSSSSSPSPEIEQEAVQLAQITQQVRMSANRHDRYAYNYGTIAFRAIDRNGNASLWDMPQHPRAFLGRADNQGGIDEHSEQKSWDWLLDQGLPPAMNQPSWAQVQTVQVIVYSQVIVCSRCQGVMRHWKKDLVTQTGKQAEIYVYQHATFNLRTPESGAVSSIDDLQLVNIPFLSLLDHLPRLVPLLSLRRAAIL